MLFLGCWNPKVAIDFNIRGQEQTPAYILQVKLGPWHVSVLG